MSTRRPIREIEIDWPHFGEAERPAPASVDEFLARIQATRQRMDALNLTHLVVYGDREHFANLAYLTGFDPRFEEALLIIQQDGDPLLVVGNECAGYLSISPLYNANRLRAEIYQPFSLLNQPRSNSRQIKEIFAAEGIGPQSRIGCAGWKYYTETEHTTGNHAIELPAYLVDTLRELAGWHAVTNATAIFMNPQDGLRAICSPAEIAYFEYTNILASEGMRRILFGLADCVERGLSDHDLAQLARFNGEPLGCHMTMAAGENHKRGLTGPTGITLRRGDPLSTNVCYWGSNSCRAGWIAFGPQDLPAAAQDYVPAFAAPYMEALGAWFSLLRIGVPGGELANAIFDRLPYDQFGIFLNPGHLIHLDEWLSSPIFPGSNIPLRSGMVIQVDVIPFSPTYFSTRMEDGIVLADADLRRQLEANYPDCYARCLQRRHFMSSTLGIELSEEVLPLSNIAGLVPPYFLQPNRVLAM